jgi:hypothetical protein
MIRALAAALVLSRLSRGRYRRLPLAPGAPPLGVPVSVVVPARDEAERIAGALAPRQFADIERRSPRPLCRTPGRHRGLIHRHFPVRRSDG